MLYACDQRFDVRRNLENFCEIKKAQYKFLAFLFVLPKFGLSCC